MQMQPQPNKQMNVLMEMQPSSNKQMNMQKSWTLKLIA